MGNLLLHTFVTLYCNTQLHFTSFTTFSILWSLPCVTRWVPRVEQELLTPQQHINHSFSFHRNRVAHLYFAVCFSHVDSVVDLILFMFFVMCLFIFIYDFMVITSW